MTWLGIAVAFLLLLWSSVLSPRGPATRLDRTTVPSPDTAVRRQRRAAEAPVMTYGGRCDWLMGGTPSEVPARYAQVSVFHHIRPTARSRCSSTGHTTRWHPSPPSGDWKIGSTKPVFRSQLYTFRTPTTRSTCSERPGHPPHVRQSTYSSGSSRSSAAKTRPSPRRTRKVRIALKPCHLLYRLRPSTDFGRVIPPRQLGS